MDAINTQSFVHDGYVFYYTDEAIEHKSDFDSEDLTPDNKTIGFYFDLMGFPRRILLKSSYGMLIIKQYNQKHPHACI